jgi:N-acetylglutamate synthase-like GNAT family acetyltransferase
VNLEIHKARMGDVQTIMDLHADTIRRINSKDYTSDQIDAWIGTRERRREMTEEGIQQGRFWVAVDETGHVLGIGALAGDEITGLYVAADHLGKGVGTALLTRMEQEARAAGAAEVRADSTLTAAGFYRRMGYEETGRKQVGKPNLNVVCMRKKLKSD